jgi:hypothetical protein
MRSPPEGLQKSESWKKGRTKYVIGIDAGPN